MIRRVAGESVVAHDRLVAAASGMSRLSVREREVLNAAVDGSTVADIAGTLFLSAGTVRNYLSSAIGKTGARNRMEAIWIAQRRGWLRVSVGLTAWDRFWAAHPLVKVMTYDTCRCRGSVRTVGRDTADLAEPPSSHCPRSQRNGEVAVKMTRIVLGAAGPSSSGSTIPISTSPS